MTMRVFIDCTGTYCTALNTGIQRTVRNIVKYRNSVSADGVDCVPVVHDQGRFAPLPRPDEALARGKPASVRGRLDRAYGKGTALLASLVPSEGAKKFLTAHRSEFGLAQLILDPAERLVRLIRRLEEPASPIDWHECQLPCSGGDILFLPDTSWTGVDWASVDAFRNAGGRVVFLVYDMIPLTHSNFCPSRFVETFGAWLADMAKRADGVLCISQFALETFRQHVGRFPIGAQIPSDVVYLGCDLAAPQRSTIRNRRLARALDSADRVFGCVGTLEPRKNHDLLIDAFERLWATGDRSRLLIVGRAGWLCDELISRIRRHPLRDRQLYWFDDVDDQDLALTYDRLTSLIFSSRVEGFGLPLVEALSRRIPVIASDIPVFREIAGGAAALFEADSAEALANAISELGTGRKEDSSIDAKAFSWPTWEESVATMLQKVVRIVENAV